jgi:hypothetical protein
MVIIFGRRPTTLDKWSGFGPFLPGVISVSADEFVVVGEDHQLRAVAGSGFHHGPVDVGLGGGDADEQTCGYLRIGQALADEAGDLEFSCGEIPWAAGRLVPGWWIGLADRALDHCCGGGG